MDQQEKIIVAFIFVGLGIFFGIQIQHKFKIIQE